MDKITEPKEGEMEMAKALKILLLHIEKKNLDAYLESKPLRIDSIDSYSRLIGPNKPGVERFWVSIDLVMQVRKRPGFYRKMIPSDI